MTKKLDETALEQAKQRQQLNAYWYSFDATGVPEIDLILGVLGSAGKAYHHTEMWTDDDDGPSYIDMIQAAANAAAQRLTTAQPARPDAVRELVDVAGRLCDALDREAEGIGGQTSISLLPKLGPAVDAAKDALTQSPEVVGGERDVEATAQAIYELPSFGADRRDAAHKTPWVPNGNSDMQQLARDFARAALSTDDAETG